MNALIAVFVLAVAAVNAAPSGLLATGYVAHDTPLVVETIGPLGAGSITQGPGSKTIVAGPDGSVISSADQGGVVATDSVSASVVAPATSAVVSGPVAAPVVSVAPVEVVAAPVAYSAPVAYTAPAVVAEAPVVVAHAAPAVISPVVESTVIAGPSGIISTSKHVDVAVAPIAPVVAHSIVADHAPATIVEARSVVSAPVVTDTVLSHGLVGYGQILASPQVYAAPEVYAAPQVYPAPQVIHSGNEVYTIQVLADNGW